MILRTLFLLAAAAPALAQAPTELDAPLPMPETVVPFSCEDGTRFTARFRPQAREVLIESGGAPLTLAREPAEAGFDYAAAGNRLKGRAAIVRWTAAGRPVTSCRRVAG